MTHGQKIMKLSLQVNTNTTEVKLIPYLFLIFLYFLHCFCATKEQFVSLFCRSAPCRLALVTRTKG